MITTQNYWSNANEQRSKEGNINDNSPIKSGRKGEDTKRFNENYDRIFGKKKDKEDNANDDTSKLREGKQ